MKDRKSLRLTNNWIRTLHVGDQFLSAGSNDFKARVVGATAWIASPSETVELLDELGEFLQEYGNQNC